MSIREVDSIEGLGEGITIVDFWAEWCSPCKVIASVLEEIDEKCDVEILKIDIDKNSDIPMDMGIRSIPTLIFYKDGNEVDRITGSVNASVIEEKIKELE